MNLTVDSEMLAEQLGTLATFSDAPAPAVTRVVFSEADLKARGYLKTLFDKAGLEVREDAVGNTFARWHGSEPTLPAVATGSHIDAIPNAGMYDGTVGVLGGLAAIRALKESGYQPARSIELIMFTAEEPTRFGIGCMGSRMLSGTLTSELARELRDSNGRTLDEVRKIAGFSECLNDVSLAPGCYSGFVELHIEQGPILEEESFQIGVVTNIAAPASLKITITGEGGHAGAVLMPQRKDALMAAAELCLAVEAAAKNSGGADSVATVGVCDVFPGAVNSIPSRVRLEIDARDTVKLRRDQMLTQIQAASFEIASRRGVLFSNELVNADNPAASDPGVVAAITQTCRSLNLTFRTMVSRAYHDSLFMARLAPISMIFVPCRAGVSHRPDEYCSPKDIETGVQVLGHTLALLASKP